LGDADYDETEIKAATYNLNNGTIKQDLLRKEQVFTDKVSKNQYIKKFTLPGITAGSVIDVEYTIKTEYYDILPTWFFQSEYPTLWSEFQVEIPSILHYTYAAKGYNKLFIDEQQQYYKDLILVLENNYTNYGYQSFGGVALLHRWAMKNTPALKKEPFTSSIENHLSQIELQLSRIVTYEAYEVAINTSWTQAVKRLNKAKNFGANLYYDNYWLDKDMKTLCGNVQDTLLKAKLIYNYLKDKFVCTGDNSIYIESEDIRQVYKTKKGNSSELNLLFVAMLQHENINAFPAILSTKNNGIALTGHPFLRQYNRTVVYLAIGGIHNLIDVSDPLLSFGKLPAEYYNGAAMVIVSDGIPVNLVPDNLKEQKSINIKLAVSREHLWEGKVQLNYGYYESLDIRKRVKQNGLDGVTKEYNIALEQGTVSNTSISNVEKIEEPVIVNYNVAIDSNESGVIYINPLLGIGLNTNPLKNSNRLYPVEMPYASDESYDCEIAIPKGYAIQDLPENYQILLNGGDGLFEYIVTKQPDKVIVHSRVVFHKTKYEPALYGELRDFFKDVAVKHSQQIVFKKTAQ
jgi:hypothetical protein